MIDEISKVIFNYNLYKKINKNVENQEKTLLRSFLRDASDRLKNILVKNFDINNTYLEDIDLNDLKNIKGFGRQKITEFEDLRGY